MQLFLSFKKIPFLSSLLHTHYVSSAQTLIVAKGCQEEDRVDV